MMVYVKRPFAGAASVIEYLRRYSHKVAISNHRIKTIEDHKVYFAHKNHRMGQAP